MKVIEIAPARSVMDEADAADRRATARIDQTIETLRYWVTPFTRPDGSIVCVWCLRDLSRRRTCRCKKAVRIRALLEVL